jgi:hypothetical protein
MISACTEALAAMKRFPYWFHLDMRHRQLALIVELSAPLLQCLALMEANIAPQAEQSEAKSGEQPGEGGEWLSDNEYTILRALRDNHPRRVILEDLAAATRIARKACGTTVTSLTERGLAMRPSKRTGATITPAGLRLLDAADALAR